MKNLTNALDQSTKIERRIFCTILKTGKAIRNLYNLEFGTDLWTEAAALNELHLPSWLVLLQVAKDNEVVLCDSMKKSGSASNRWLNFKIFFYWHIKSVNWIGTLYLRFFISENEILNDKIRYILFSTVEHVTKGGIIIIFFIFA